MKTFVKIAAIALITALAALSCAPEITETQNEWWEEYNKQFDGSAYIIDQADMDKLKPTIGDGTDLKYGADRVNTVYINFPKTADVLKQEKPETELNNFLSFWTFNPVSVVKKGEVTTLTELKGWVLQRRIGNTLVVDLKTTFTSTSEYSGVVVKINGTKYTYSNGSKIDIDGNGIPGEEGYDDYYKCLPVSGSPASTGTFVQPGNRNWTVTLVDLSITPEADDTSTASSLYLISDDFLTDFGISDGDIPMADYDDILNALVGGFKVEKFSDGKWENHAAASFNSTLHDIIVENNSFSHMKGYRVVFEKGSISLETAKTFYGVKQRIKVKEASTGKEIYNTKKNVTRLEGKPALYFNKTKRNFDFYLKDKASLEIYSKDGSNKNIVLRLKINEPIDLTSLNDNSSGIEAIKDSVALPAKYKYYYFKTVDLAAFKNNFKIYENFKDENFREIGITAVEFKRENPFTEFSGSDEKYDVKGENVIYITLDPTYKQNKTPKTFLVGDGIGYASDIGVFSAGSIWDKNKGFYPYSVNDFYTPEFTGF